MEAKINLFSLAKGFTDGLFKTGAYLGKTTLDKKLLELINYKVSQMNGCAYCLDMHSKDAAVLGEEAMRLHTIAAFEECPYYSDAEKAALRFAESLTRAQAPEHLVEDLEQYFSTQEIADLCLAIATINTWNRLNLVFKPVPGTYKPGLFAATN
ncbi:carboxymuconolactone decarboxylase [Chitinophaga caeni]|uniref:Carboxymuconolactone decarboxylase n=1 Tax=Chitinophaga caeni TaxID=2029983 RepID=A0A291QZV4_9BACT|nr:carboxymuconolactone decarboxylase family protein [Chitinophaga caeni]ATL49441.1 carboxymuconolactone decarboxylase [Chitinophaga caeni]